MIFLVVLGGMMFLIVEKWNTLDLGVVERDNCLVYCVTTLTSSFILNSTPFPQKTMSGHSGKGTLYSIIVLIHRE